MIIRRKSPLSGVVRNMEIDVTDEQLERWQDGMPIQRAMPRLTASEREFIMTGIIDEEWETLREPEE